MRRPAGGEVSPTAALADEARVALGRFRTAWSWLAEAVHPGTGPGARPNRYRRGLDPDEQAAAFERYRYEREVYVIAVARGAKPSAPHALPVVDGAADVRQRTAAQLAELAGRMWEWVHGLGLVLTVVEQGRTIACPWCQGAGYALRPPDWPAPVERADGRGVVGMWPDHPIICSYCQGRTVVPAGLACPACDATGGCRCDRYDVIVALSLDTVARLVDHLGAEPLAIVASTVDKAAARAERAVGAGQDRRRMPGQPECPACGTRELYAEVSSRDPREWSIRCGYAECECEGPFCPCQHGTDARAGRRHVWPSRMWDGPVSLAELLGVASPEARKTFDEYLDDLAEQAHALYLGHLYRTAAAAGRVLPIVARKADHADSTTTGTQ